MRVVALYPLHDFFVNQDLNWNHLSALLSKWSAREGSNFHQQSHNLPCCRLHHTLVSQCWWAWQQVFKPHCLLEVPRSELPIILPEPIPEVIINAYYLTHILHIAISSPRRLH